MVTDKTSRSASGQLLKSVTSVLSVVKKDTKEPRIVRPVQREFAFIRAIRGQSVLLPTNDTNESLIRCRSTVSDFSVLMFRIPHSEFRICQAASLRGDSRVLLWKPAGIRSVASGGV